MPANTVTLHRILKAPVEKVFRAFSNANALAVWLPPYGFLCEVHDLDFRIGGSFSMSFINFSTGHRHSFGGKYLELIPNELIRQTDAFDDPNLPGLMTTSTSFRSSLFGTEVHIIQEGIPEMIPVEMCYLGWQESLDKLMRLVEPVIPDA